MKNKVAIVSSNYYENITEGLVTGAKDKLDPSFDVYDYVVDGAWELVYKINQLSSNDSIDKFIEQKLKQAGHSLDEKNKVHINLNPDKDEIILKGQGALILK